MINGDNNKEKESQPGAQVGAALLLVEEGEKPVDSVDIEQEEILYAATLILVRDKVSGELATSAFSSCLAEGKEFPLNQELLNTLVTLMKDDLNVSRTIRSLAEVLTSQEDEGGHLNSRRTSEY